MTKLLLALVLARACGGAPPADPTPTPEQETGDEAAESTEALSEGPCVGGELALDAVFERCRVQRDLVSEVDPASVPITIEEGGPYPSGRNQRVYLRMTNVTDAPIEVVADGGSPGMSARLYDENGPVDGEEGGMAIGRMMNAPVLAFTLLPGGSLRMYATVDLSRASESCMGSNCVVTRGAPLEAGEYRIFITTPFDENPNARGWTVRSVRGTIRVGEPAP